ncbi:MAG: hypothetical protein AAF899_20210, partial [Pseudomonadota bacterium]
DFMGRKVMTALRVEGDSGEVTGRAPSAIAPAIFAREALVWLGVDLDANRQTSIRDQLSTIANATVAGDELVGQGKSLLAERLTSVLAGIEDKAEAAEKTIAEWYDNTIQRVGGWYRRRVRTVLFWTGLVFAVTLNINLVEYSATLLTNDAQREAAVRAAQAAAAIADLSEVRPNAQVNLGPDATADLNELLAKIDQLQTEMLAAASDLNEAGAALGWTTAAWPPSGEGTTWFGRLWAFLVGQGDAWFWLTGLMSWFAVGFGTMLGAQFWFDLLKTLVNLRTRGAASAQRT